MPDAGVPSSVRVVLFTDVVGSTDLKSRLGTHAYLPLLQRHNELFTAACARFRGRVVKHTGDGFLALFDAASDAVRAALVFQRAMRAEPWTPEPLRTRVGIHSGELAETEVGGQKDVTGLAADLAARVMSLAQGGQILLTRWPFNDARQFVPVHPACGEADPPLLRWVAHGQYLFKGNDEALEVFEVGAESVAPLSAPPNSDKARRVVPHEQEATLGWRPAVGLEVDARPGWMLERKLGEGGFGEVWLARHALTKELRAFKFCFDAERLRSFKRELTVFRLLRGALGDRHDIARLHEVRLDKQPFYLESEYVQGGNLTQWAAARGGIDKVPPDRRLEIVAAIAEALAAAHSIGVLHKDVKPSNVLMQAGANGAATPLLADFGIGLLTDRAQDVARDITLVGFSLFGQKDSSPTAQGMYSPPEILAGKPFTIQGDIYALGVLLYQMVVADLERPLAQGWERDVPDELLREDIAACVHGDPSDRIGSAAELATRLRDIDRRRAERKAALAAAQAALRRRRVVRAAEVLSGVAGILFAAGVVALTLHVRRLTAEKKATEEAFRKAIEEKSRADRSAALARRRLSEAYAAEAMRLVEAQQPTVALLWLARAIEEAQVEPAPDTIAERNARLQYATTLSLAPRLFDFRADRSTPVDPDRARARGARLVQNLAEGVRVVDADTGRALTPTMQHEGQVRSAAFSRDGMKLATVGGKTGRIWNAVTGELITRLLVDEAEGLLLSAAFSPDGAKLATASEGGIARVWEVATGRPLCPPLRHTPMVRSLALDSAGTRLATAGGDTTRVWEVTTGRPLAPPLQHQDRVVSVALSDDGTKLASGTGMSMVAQVWDAGNGRPLSPPMRHNRVVSSVAFNPDGTRLATACRDNTARVWDAATGRPLTPTMQHWKLGTVAFSRGGTRLMTTSWDEVGWETGRAWDISEDPRPTDELRAIAEVLAAGSLDELGALHRFTPEQSAAHWDAMRRKYPDQFRPWPAPATASAAAPATQPADQAMPPE